MELSNLFKKGIAEFLSTNGFIQENEEGYYFRKNNDALYFVIMNMSVKSGRYCVIPEICVKSYDVEKVRKVFKEIPYNGSKYYATIPYRQHMVADYFAKPEHRILNYLFDNGQTMEESLWKFESFMVDIGFSFLNKFNSLIDFDDWFNIPVIERRLDFSKTNLANWAIEGLIAAKLTQNSYYEEIFEIWIRTLKESGRYSKTIESYKALKVFLDKEFSQSTFT